MDFIPNTYLVPGRYWGSKFIYLFSEKLILANLEKSDQGHLRGKKTPNKYSIFKTRVKM